MKRIMILLASLALIASGFQALPASAAEEAPEVPALANIEDPVEDANFLNSGTAGPLGQDNVTPADASTVGDLIKVWFSNDAEKVSVHFLTQAAAPATVAVAYQAYVTPGEGEAGSSAVGCLRFVGLIPGSGPGGGTYQGEPFIRLVDRCNVGTSIFNDSVEGEFSIAPGPDKGGILTLTFPRNYSPLLASGLSLTAPTAQTSSPTVGHSDVGFAAPSTDNTKVGTDYILQEGSSSVTPPPGKDPVPGKKKGCDNGKGKKRGCEGKGKKSPKPGAPSASCAPFTSGEAGAGKATVTVTDAATADKPLEQTVALEQSTADVEGDPTFDFFNVVVDSEAATAGLYATFEFPAARDYDLDLLHTDGSYAARSHGFNPVGALYATPLLAGREGHGGKTTTSSESLVGINTNDCGGWTIRAANWLGEGGEFTVKLWLGEGQVDPQEPGAETDG